jgi:excisionase family DNA binding protein
MRDAVKALIGWEGTVMTPELQRPGTKDEILTASDVAAELRCSKAHVCKVIRGQVSGVGALPAIHMGRRVLIRRSSLEQWKIDSEAGAADVILRPSPEVHAAKRTKGNGHA